MVMAMMMTGRLLVTNWVSEFLLAAAFNGAHPNFWNGSAVSYSSQYFNDYYGDKNDNSDNSGGLIARQSKLVGQLDANLVPVVRAQVSEPPLLSQVNGKLLRLPIYQQCPWWPLLTIDKDDRASLIGNLLSRSVELQLCHSDFLGVILLWWWSGPSFK